MNWQRLRATTTSWPLFWSLFGVLGFLTATALALPALWQGLLLAIPLFIATVGWGWRDAAPIVPLALVIIWLGQRPGAEHYSAWFYLGSGVVLLLGLVSGQSIYQLWRRSERRALESARRAHLLSEAAVHLERTRDAEDIYRLLPLLLFDIMHFAHATVFVPVPEGDRLELIAAHRGDLQTGYLILLDSVCGRAYRTQRWQVLSDTRDDPDFIQAPGTAATRSELAIPLHCGERDRVVAVLNIEDTHPHSFDEDKQRVLEAFAQLANQALLRVHTQAQLAKRLRERDMVATLNRNLLASASAEEIAHTALGLLSEHLSFDLGAMFVIRKGRFYPLALLGDAPDTIRQTFQQGLAWGRGQIHRSWQEKRDLFIDDYQQDPLADPDYRRLGVSSIALVPVTNIHGDVQALLELASLNQIKHWQPDERELLRSVADPLGIALERVTTDTHLREMFEVIRQLAQSNEPHLLYQRAVEAAVRLIPDAEAASLLVRTADGFEFESVSGFDLVTLQDIPPLSEQEIQNWYGSSQDALLSGKARILHGNNKVREHSERAVQASGQDRLNRSGRLLDILSNIAVPICHQQELVAVLNIDNFTREDAFGVSAAILAEAFAQQIAVIIRQTQYRQALEQNVVTDPLTKLGNRAGFNHQFTRELNSAQRYRYPLSLILMDLNGFKRINDTYGHQAGDEALIVIAQAMRQELRRADSLYRWGGDEFALILPQTDREHAAIAARRYRDTVAQLTHEYLEISVSLGIASYPEDSEDGETLIRLADDEMYQQKSVNRVERVGG